MSALTVLLLLAPLAALASFRRLAPDQAAKYGRKICAVAVLVLAATGALPFLTSHAVGTGEAYNYSLAVADGVTQMRSGRLPVLVGQTEYAWNGRIHPLRTAPGIIYAAGLLDAVTGHHLDFWTLQNLVLALALAGATLLFYGGLRRWLQAEPRSALVATVAFALSPGLLAPAYTGDLYMTVLVAPFAVLVVLVNLRSLTDSKRTDPWWLAAGLGAAWWVHAPVAAWLTLITAGLQILGLITGPDRLARLGRLAILAAAGAGLAFYPFVSVLTIMPSTALHKDYVGTILQQVYGSGFGALGPVGGPKSAVTDYQLGYLLWLLFGATTWRVLWPRTGMSWRERLSAGALLMVALVLLVLVLPIPRLTAACWRLLPADLGMITNVWPMQRLYLIAAALVAAAAGWVWTRCPPSFRRGNTTLVVVVAAGLLWSAYEARYFIVDYGFGSRRTAAETARGHRPDNLDLTVTSYSFLGVPSDFNYGVMDPSLEARLLRAGREPVAGDWTAAEGAAGTVVDAGVLTVAQAYTPREFLLTPQFTLQPGRHYILRLAGARPVPGQLEVHGPDYFRRYSLEDRLAPHGFGLLPGNRPALALYNSRKHPVPIKLVLALDAAPPGWVPGTTFARFTLREVATDRLPVRLVSFLPLTYRVRCPEDDCCVETIRRFVPGYAATVNGRPAGAFRAPDGNVMVPVPKGMSTVVVRYPGPPLVRVAFWISLAAGGVIFLFVAAAASGIDRVLWRKALRPALGRAFRPFGDWRVTGATVAAVVAVAATASAWHRHVERLRSVGPLCIRVLLPSGLDGTSQPILTTGRQRAGAVVYVLFVDESHIRVGADIWGGGAVSPPLPVNYFEQQTFVIDSSALYPTDNPVVRALNPLARHVLLNRLRVDLNGREVLQVPRNAFPTTLKEITVGRMDIGASTAGPRFTGDIESVRRLPIAQPLILAPGAALRIRLRFPAATKGAQPICALGPNGRDGLCYVEFLPAGKLRVGYLRPDGSRIESALVPARVGRLQEMRIEPGLAKAGGHPLTVAVTLDGRHLLGPSPAAPGDRPRLLTVGLNAGNAAGVALRFTGPELDVVGPVPGRVPRTGIAAGPCRMIVMFPTDKSGQTQPLVTTGRTGAGDFIYVSYVDAHHVRFGFDHWGIGGKVSAPVALDLSVPHVVEVAMGSLDPAPTDDRAWQGVPPARRAEITRRRWVRIDGRTVLQADLPCYPTKPGKITLGRNRIGGSTCTADFSGIIYSVSHPGLTH